MKHLRLVSVVVAFLGSIAFQLSLAVWPQKLQSYSWAVKYIWICWMLGLIVWILVWRFAKEGRSAVPAASAIPPITFAPVITQNANPVVVQNQLAPEQLPPQRGMTQPELEPNIVCIGTETIRMLQSDSYTFNSARDAQIRGEFVVGIAAIANRPAPRSAGVAPVRGISAQLIYRNDKHEVYSGLGAWSGQFSNNVDFLPAQSHKLIIVLQSERLPGLVFGMTNPRPYRLPSRWPALKNALENSPYNDMRVITDPVFDIEATLLANGRVLGIFLFKCERNGTALSN